MSHSKTNSIQKSTPWTLNELRLSQSLSKQDSFAKNLEELVFLKEFFQALKRGSKKDAEFIVQTLSEDPRRMAFEPSHAQRRGNLQNLNGEFPLYIAAKYNHIRIIKLLVGGSEGCRSNSESALITFRFLGRTKRAFAWRKTAWKLLPAGDTTRP